MANESKLADGSTWLGGHERHNETSIDAWGGWQGSLLIDTMVPSQWR